MNTTRTYHCLHFKITHVAGLYLHIPFCESRCIYCGFYSTTSLEWRERYTDALCQEMRLRPIAQALGEEQMIDTIYLGGGTPSTLSTKQLHKIFDNIHECYGKYLAEELEVTIECNPDDISIEFCQAIKDLPINRISLGAQTFSDERLRFLHRRHNSHETRQAVNELRKAGYKNISLDLMFGFPQESLQEWENDLREMTRLNPEHISAYSLMYEEGTSLYKMLEHGNVEEIDEDTYRKMYETLIDVLTESGYEHYEISNFAHPGFRSRHNSSYWNETPYIGLGAAAHSYKRAPQVERSWNISSIGNYMRSIEQGVLPTEKEVLNLESRYNDLITTALRTSDGIDLKKMELEFGTTLYYTLIKEANKHIERQLMQINENRLSLTRKGLYISDDIMSDFMLV